MACRVAWDDVVLGHEVALYYVFLGLGVILGYGVGFHEV